MGTLRPKEVISHVSVPPCACCVWGVTIIHAFSIQHCAPVGQPSNPGHLGWGSTEGSMRPWRMHWGLGKVTDSWRDAFREASWRR